ncbi:MAG: Crp/Fnr family transcriptional regulator [Flavobacteriales bacterium]|nr:Crp/Fnr family transcriptional regulator [Flavobacteriales bacterium]
MAFSQIKVFYQKLVPDITEEMWKELESKLVLKFFEKGEFYIEPGMVENHVTFINKGGFRCFTISQDKETISGFCFENEYISEYESFLMRKASGSYIQSLEPTEVVMLHYDDVQFFYKKYSQFQQFGRIIAENFLIEMFNRNNEIMSFTPEQRYDEILAKTPDLIQRVPQYMIASYIGVTPEALSRIRKRKAYSLI